MDYQLVTEDLVAAIDALSLNGKMAADAEEILRIVQKQPANFSGISDLATPVLSTNFGNTRGAFCIVLGMAYETLDALAPTSEIIAGVHSLGPLVFSLLQDAQQDPERSALLYLFSHFPCTVNREQWASLGALEISQLSLATKPAIFTAKTLSFADSDSCPQDAQELERLWRKSRDCLWSFLGARAYWALFSDRLEGGSK